VDSGRSGVDLLDWGLVSLSESETIGCARLGAVGCLVVTVGETADLSVGVGLMILWSRVRSASCVVLRCAAVVLDMRTCARFAVAAMMASAGVTVGFVMYLCLKNTVAEMRVDRDAGVQTVQHR
jgi:hypothetical protein